MNKLSAPSVYIFIALLCEAKPLIQKYGLKKWQQHHPFDIFRNDEMAVIITGVGKVAMAGAVTYSMAVLPKTQNPVLINLGIAGHKHKTLGNLYLADKIVDADNRIKKFYPQLIGNFPASSMMLTTVSIPDTKYSDDCLYDMEGSAFYEMAIKFSSSELIHCLKIISDNQQQSVATINAKTVSELIDQQFAIIDKIIKHLMHIRHGQGMTETQSAMFIALIERYHFTVTARIKLKTLLQRWDVVTKNSPLEINYCEFDSSKKLLKWLEQQIEKQPFYL